VTATREEQRERELRAAAIDELRERGSLSLTDAEFLEQDDASPDALAAALYRLLKIEILAVRERWAREGKDYGDDEREAI